MSWQILQGDVRERLADIDDESVQTCVTSPPYWGLRDYGTAVWKGGDSECDHAPDKRGSRFATPVSSKQASNAGSGSASARDCPCGAKRIDFQLGLEPTPEEYVANLVGVFREVRRVLRDDGTVWLNLGDSYAGSGKGPSNSRPRPHSAMSNVASAPNDWVSIPDGIKSKDLIGIPWRVAFALQADGWWLRSDIIWNKPNPMPESVTDRPTRAHEYIFLLTKSARYFYDADAIRETWADEREGGSGTISLAYSEQSGRNGDSGLGPAPGYSGRNKRSVWTVTTQPYAEAHFATFPPKLVEPCILAGTPPKCCGECGAPWERVTEKVAIRDLADGGPRAGAKLAGRQEQGLTSKRTGLSASNSHNASTPQSPEIKTVGWQPTCTCHYQEDSLATFKPDDSGRSLVLDPFAGSGTTGVVALRHDRSFLGIELSPDYCELARNRIRDDAPLLNAPLELAAMTIEPTKGAG